MAPGQFRYWHSDVPIVATKAGIADFSDFECSSHARLKQSVILNGFSRSVQVSRGSRVARRIERRDAAARHVLQPATAPPLRPAKLRHRVLPWAI